LGPGEEAEIAAVIEVQVREDDDVDIVWTDTDLSQGQLDAACILVSPLTGDPLGESRVDQHGEAWVSQHPEVEVAVHWTVGLLIQAVSHEGLRASGLDRAESHRQHLGRQAGYRL
jgi:hypothetical protein